ncbi:MAG: hypothetical protein RLZZ444_1890 [Pseudomonadota bacterium]
MSKLYVPSAGQRIIMPGNQPDWPAEGQAINPRDSYHRMLVRDGDLVEVKAARRKRSGGAPAATDADSSDTSISTQVGKSDTSEEV